MENNLGGKESITLSEVRLILIGGRWAGKSSSGNTILRKGSFECGRTRTAQSEVRHEVVDGRKLTVVDAPGWSNSRSLTEIPEGNKQRFKLNVCKCPPGPHVFLLVIPIDSAFSVEQRSTVEAHMKLLGKQAWRFTMVLFTCEDFLGEGTIEEHIESEGDALKWLIERCSNRYHVFNNQEKSDLSQVTTLLEKIDEMVWSNSGRYYKVDEQMLYIIKEKQQEVAVRAEKRRRRAEEYRRQIESLISEMKPIQKLCMILLGSRSVGKTSVANAIFGIKAQESGKRTAHSVAQQGARGKTEITVVDTPGWWKGFAASDTPEAIKDELRLSVFLCPPGPHVFLVVVDADASFNANHLEAVTTHVELLGKGVWRRTMVIFTRGDWLGTHTIEEYIEGEGEALQSLIELCENRYHVIDNKNPDDGTQITELLEKITGTAAGNGSYCFIPDKQIFLDIEERRRRVEEGAGRRKIGVKTKRKGLADSRNRLQELRIVMLGQKTNGKSTTGNNLLRKEVFTTCENKLCQVQEAEVAGRLIKVIDTPGWWEDCSRCTKDLDKEIVRGLSLSPLGVHAVLLVIPLDMTFRDVQQMALENHMSLYDDSVWKHTMVLFTYGDKLADRSAEEHIEREHSALRWLVDKCKNNYHVMNNMKKNDTSQVTELLEKIEEMVAGNNGQLFCPDMYDIHLGIEEKFKRRQLKNVLKQRLIEEYRRRELELLIGFKEKLLELQAEIRETKSKSLIADKIRNRSFGQRMKDQKEKESNIGAKISQEIEKLDKNIMKSTELLRSSIDILLPEMKEDRNSTSDFEKVLCWLSTLQIDTNVENQLTLNFSQTSGYKSVLPQNEDFYREADNQCDA
ncbi:GTPase IMAP family member 8-like [Anabas testudineus]|uniref:AIG1-type G domain-containing protein n=1 Tax=Anabas testudineus TaxID=64144 RepID=A0A7N6AN72_ANATE|nr:GTPase IMAP family member 8-like [Anabas testudineus]